MSSQGASQQVLKVRRDLIRAKQEEAVEGQKRRSANEVKIAQLEERSERALRAIEEKDDELT